VSLCVVRDYVFFEFTVVAVFINTVVCPMCANEVVMSLVHNIIIQR